MANQYTDLKQRQQEEFDAFPMQFAFSKEQFAEGMKKLGLDPAATDKIYKASGGGFYRREDSQRFAEMMDRFEKELEAAIAADKTGDGFIYEMFLSELQNHEYGYTGELGDTLDALDCTMEDIQADSRLSHGLDKAMRKIMGG